ncbi:MAG: hypothetical protein PHT07_07710 [Paludibacter sp.]|nr:hypothetical protein [Paludibacter sp.]
MKTSWHYHSKLMKQLAARRAPNLSSYEVNERVFLGIGAYF